MVTNISIRFAVGEKAWTIDKKSMKMVEFTINKITVYVDEQSTSIRLLPAKEEGGESPSWKSYAVDTCYRSKEELMKQLEG